ncbi:DUF4159 domain-containing protein [Phaeovulum sp. W22_SRMD_FR3]|uniref:DUF4159 domain-containing protein n=1 Tax=Phaeovulum sp. W22_SRMD_FR3 TaxID=3240274 RepID=UPI003F98AD3F
MWMLGPLGFTTPLLLWALAVLPLIWIFLRAVPPAPVRRRFPGVALLLGLRDEEVQADRTPWWLLLLRLLALAAAIIGFAGPVLNPVVQSMVQGPLLVVTDGSWATAENGTAQTARLTRALTEAETAGRPVALLSLTDLPAEAPEFQPAETVLAGLPGLRLKPWEPEGGDWAKVLPEGRYDTLWLSDGLARDMRGDLITALKSHGAITVYDPQRPVLALRPAKAEGSALALTVLAAGAAQQAEVTAIGLDPNGIERDLARQAVTFEPGADQAEVRFDLPPELRNRVSRFEIAGQRSAGSVTLTDDALKRRKVALVAGAAPREGLSLLSPLHYLRQALAPSADLLEGTLSDMLLASPDVVILADVAELPESAALQEWVEKGGLLIRFAGPRMAASENLSADPLLPVRLRAGGRAVGGAMSWGAPRGLAPFAEDGPFAGLPLPGDVTVRAQLMAEPAPDLSAHTLAALADGTPLVTRSALGDGAVVLFHVTANAEWSSLPLSGIFVQMLDRLAVSTAAAASPEKDLAGATWVPQSRLLASGKLADAGEAAGVAGADLALRMQDGPDATVEPGLYRAADRRVALNVITPERVLTRAVWPADLPVENTDAPQDTPLKGLMLALALGLLCLDLLAALALAGRLRGARVARASALLGVLILGLAAPQARAEMAPARALEAADNVVLAYVTTGDAAVDRVSEAGLRGLSNVLTLRTTVEPAAPMALDLNNDDLALFTLIYWPITPGQAAPSPDAYSRLNRYLRSGGMILFDTRDADIAGFGGATEEGKRLQAIAAPLDIPPLAPVPPDHVLTRTFYLLTDFPGRFADRGIWAEAPPPDAEQAEGMPFRNLNDGVTPVVIGGNDWAGAWATNPDGTAMFPVGRGMAGERQREMAYRFGVNLVMHVLTGNYKSDQVHVPALLERLGQ